MTAPNPNRKLRPFEIPANVNQAKAMIANGATDREVADALSVDRSSVTWFRRRHSIPSHAARRKQTFTRSGFAVPQPKPAELRVLKGAAWEPVPGSSPVSLIDLEPGMCKWPIGHDSPYRFCGLASGEGSYCEHHASMSRRSV